MQQPRQMYGLGSFVKKVTRKITKPVTKVAKKLVPKEIAGIMRIAAPFLPPGYREAAYLLGTAKQTGRISPVDLALTLAPTLNQKFGKEGGPGILDTKVGQTLFGQSKDPTKVSKAKVAGFGTSIFSLVTAAETPEQAGNALVAETGDPAAYEEGVRLFSALKPGVFDIREQFRLPAQAGGLMRENYALGTMPTAQESGLGGLPIEADMRYTGGFMPYGAKEKADDVPARLSKNEFVFTADAVRAAGGGSVQKGAQRMYNTMKQLEAKPEAKRMTS